MENEMERNGKERRGKRKKLKEEMKEGKERKRKIHGERKRDRMGQYIGKEGESTEDEIKMLSLLPGRQKLF